MDVTWHVKHLSARQMIVIPLTLAALCAGALTYRWMTTGSPVPLSTDFKEGALIRVGGLDNRPDANAVEQALRGLLAADVGVKITEDRTTGKFGFDAEVSRKITENEENQVIQFISTQFVGAKLEPIQSKGSVITSISKDQAWKALIGAFVLMTAVLFLIFRHSTAAGVMVLCVALDALGALGGMAIFQVPLSFGSIAALLMIIGYSVDTDILLSNHMLKRLGGEVRGRAADAMMTGLMTSGTTVVALVAIEIFTTAPLLHELSIVLIFGILADLINTWFLNVGVLLRHIERRRRREYFVGD
jgi:preprotein translocase subunit SecF